MRIPQSPHVTFHQLRIFTAVAESGGFTRAAEVLHLTQPTVSIQIRQLADAIGMPLFDVTGRTVTLTDAGRELLVTARTMFEAWSTLEMRIAELQGLKRGRLRLAAVTTAEYFIPDLLGPFAGAHPGIEVTLEVENRDNVVARLADNLDDLYVMMMPPDDADLECTPFLDNPLVAIAARDHPLARRRSVPLAALAGERFLMREKGSGTRMATEAFFAERGVAMDVKMELGSNEAIKHAVAAGLGLAVVSRHTLPKTPAREGLAVLDVAGLPIRRSWYLVHPRRRDLSPVARAFMAFAVARTG